MHGMKATKKHPLMHQVYLRQKNIQVLRILKLMVVQDVTLLMGR